MSIWNDFVSAVAKADIKYPNLKPAMVAQAILESGRGTTDVSKQCLNFHGMKFRQEMEGIASALYVKTGSEPSGGAEFCKFESVEDAVKGYWQFVGRDPYRGWEQHTKTATDFLGHIGPVWCPGGYKDEWKESHKGWNYHEYIIHELYDEALDLLKAAGWTPDTDQQKTYWAELYVSGNLYVIEQPSGKAVGLYNTENSVAKAQDAFKWAFGLGAKTFMVAPKEKEEPIAREEEEPVTNLPPYPGYLLNYGTRGQHVEHVQRRLKIDVDGIFGPQTRNAVMTFQSQHGLDVDGVVGPKTWEVMFPGSGTVVEDDPTDDFDWEIEVDRPSNWERNAKSLYIPFAEIRRDMPTAWTYPKGYPESAVIHWTAGSSAEGSYSTLRTHGYPCLVIDKDGSIIQGFPLSRGGAHSGSYHHRKMIGIEVESEGKLTPVSNGYKAWFGRILKQADVRFSEKDYNIFKGHYSRFTPAQMESLVTLLVWLKHNNPSVFSLDKIVGHDEAMIEIGRPGRKTDPGASLGAEDKAFNMRDFRRMVSDFYAEMQDELR
jgi:peptidoglycan hydrolase-like protein with peptidoglycan-binding domain